MILDNHFFLRLYYLILRILLLLLFGIWLLLVKHFFIFRNWTRHGTQLSREIVFVTHIFFLLDQHFLESHYQSWKSWTAIFDLLRLGVFFTYFTLLQILLLKIHRLLRSFFRLLSFYHLKLLREEVISHMKIETPQIPSPGQIISNRFKMKYELSQFHN